MFKNLGKWILASALSAVGCASSLYSQSTTSADLANKLYGRIAQFTSSGTGAQSGGQRFLILATPGILLDPSLDLTPTSTDYHLLSTILDRAPDASWVYRPK